MNWYGQLDMYFPRSTVEKFRSAITKEVQNIRALIESLKYRRAATNAVENI